MSLLSTSEAYKSKRGCAVQVRHIIDTNKHMQYLKEHHQYELGSAVQVKHMISTNEDVQHEQGKSSVPMRSFSTSEAHHHHN